MPWIAGMRCYSADGKDVMQCDEDVRHCVTYLALDSGHYNARYGSAPNLHGLSYNNMCERLFFEVLN